MVEKNSDKDNDIHTAGDLFNETGVSTFSDYKQQYKKSSSAKERPIICPICYQDVKTHFSRHLFRHHQDNKQVKLLQNFKPKSKERLSMIATLRKQGYFHLKVEKNILNPVRKSKNPNTEYFTCVYCLGQYSKKLLYKHVKKCTNRPENEMKPGKNCQARSQTFTALINQKNSDFLKSSRIKNEVFDMMRADNISEVAKNDPLICLYGETLLHKHKRQQIPTLISNKIREMGRLLIALRTINPEIRGLFDVIKPDMFQSLISATKIISGYDVKTKSFRSPSLALHMGTNLKIVCDIAFKIVLEKRRIANIMFSDRENKKSEIKDLKKLIEGHWCTEISSLALKNLKEKHWKKSSLLPLTSDIKLFREYLQTVADDAFQKLSINIDIKTNYKILTECVLAQVVIFNRKRVGDVQYLRIDTYNKDSSTTSHDNFTDSLTEVEKILCKKFKRVVSGGKGTKPVPILFSEQIQKYIKCLLNIRTETDIVPHSNPYIFANCGSENKWMAGVNVIGKLARRSGAKHPELLTSTKFRKHIATTLQLMSMDDNDMEQIATFMGHTKKTHMEFYRLPQDIYQTSKVAKILMLLEKGKGSKFKGKSLDEIQLEQHVYYSSESESDSNLSPADKALEIASRSKQNTISFCDEVKPPEKTIKKKNVPAEELSSRKPGRVKWSVQEKKVVAEYFAKHIKEKITPKKHECIACLEANKHIICNKDWIRIKTFIYNTFR